MNEKQTVGFGFNQVFLKKVDVALIRKALHYYRRNHPDARKDVDEELKNWEEAG